MADKRIKDLPLVTSLTAGDKFVIDGATTRAITHESVFGNVAITGGSITGMSAPTLAADVTTKSYVDEVAGTDVNITGGSITGMANPVSALDVANKQYVDAVATGLSPMASVRLATAAVLPNTPTYANGASGVGATLTAGSNAAIVVDGVSASLNDSVLVKNQASAFQNGIYTVTTVGSGGAAWVLTRRTDFDTNAEMLAGSYFLVTAGSTNSNTGWVLQTTVATVGTTAATFTQFATASGDVRAANALSEYTSAASTARANIYAPAASALAHLNIVTNSGFLVGQEHGDTAVSSGNVSAGAGFNIGDTHRLFLNLGTGQLDYQRVTGALVGFQKAQKLTMTTNQTPLLAGDVIHAGIHRIEGVDAKSALFGGGSARSVTVCARVKYSKSATINFNLANAAEDRNYIHDVALTANTETFVRVVFPGCTTGTWPTDNTTWGFAFMTLGGGSTFVGTADTWNTTFVSASAATGNFAAVNGETFQWSGFMVFIGDVPITEEIHADMVRRESVELPLVQRRYFDITSAASVTPTRATGHAYSTTKALVTVNHPVTMGGSPTLDFSAVTPGHFGLTDQTLSTVIPLSATPATFVASSSTTSSLDLTVASGLIAGDGTELYSKNVSAGSKIKFRWTPA